MIGFLRGTVPTLTRRSTWVGRGALTASGELTRRILECGSTNRRLAAGSSAANSPGCMLGCRAMRVVENRQLLSEEEIGRTLQRLGHGIIEKNGGTKNLRLFW